MLARIRISAVVLTTLLAAVTPVRGQVDYITVSGRVTDAETGAPIERFWVVRGFAWEHAGADPSPIFVSSSAEEFGNGDYSQPLEVAPHYRQIFVRIEADGYLPVVSGPLKSDLPEATFDAQLHRGQNISGKVVSATGEPIEGADVMLSMLNMPVYLQNFRPMPADSATNTDASGAFSFRPCAKDEDYSIIVLHDSGYAVLSKQESKADRPTTLQPWARIEGTLKIGADPAAGAPVTLSRITSGIDDWQANSRSEVKTDANGAFIFDRVMAGSNLLGRMVEVKFGDQPVGIVAPTCTKTIEIKPGETMNVVLGGTGRPIVGKFELPADMPRERIWMNAWLVGAARVNPAPAAWKRLLPGAATRPANVVVAIPRYPLSIDDDGSFRIDDVEAGEYTLDVHIGRVPESADGGAFKPEPVVEVSRAVSVAAMPNGRSDDPLGLGSIPMKIPQPATAPSR